MRKKRRRVPWMAVLLLFPWSPRHGQQIKQLGADDCRWPSGGCCTSTCSTVQTLVLWTGRLAHTSKDVAFATSLVYYGGMFLQGRLTESTVLGKGNLLHITVPLGSKASLITVTIPLLMKYPSVSLASSWTLSTLIIYKINKSCENNLR